MEEFRQEDKERYIYWANVFQHIHGEDMTTTGISNDEAFWIGQKFSKWQIIRKSKQWWLS